MIIPLLRGRPAAYSLHHARAQANGRAVLVSSIVVYELRYGAERSSRPDQARALLERYLSGPIESVEFDHDDAAEAGRLRAELARVGSPVGPYDVLIAAQARRRACTLATGNVGEFSRVAGLQIEDWTV